MTKRVLSMIVAMGLMAAAVAAGQEIGRIAYLEGSVTLFQEGEEAYADIGVPIFEGDLVRTGADGFVELELDVGPSTVTVTEGTALYVTQESAGGRTETKAELLRGDVDFVVGRLVRGDSLSVQSGSVVAGVRGTEFKVRTSPDDSVAVGVTEGRVGVSGESNQVVADAGVAVESVNRGRVESQQVGADAMDDFLAQWEEIRMQAFRSGATTFVQAYGRRYLDQYPRFIEAYRALASYEDELREAGEDSGMRGRGQRFQLRAEVTGPATQVRSILPIFENTFYRLDELEGYHAEGLGRTRINGEMDSREFFRQFNSRWASTERQLANARYLLELYARLEEGTMGGLPSGESPFGSDDLRPSF